jgi:hypothetical protein
MGACEICSGRRCGLVILQAESQIGFVRLAKNRPSGHSDAVGIECGVGKFGRTT